MTTPPSTLTTLWAASDAAARANGTAVYAVRAAVAAELELYPARPPIIRGHFQSALASFDAYKAAYHTYHTHATRDSHPATLAPPPPPAQLIFPDAARAEYARLKRRNDRFEQLLDLSVKLRQRAGTLWGGADVVWKFAQTDAQTDARHGLDAEALRALYGAAVAALGALAAALETVLHGEELQPTALDRVAMPTSLSSGDRARARTAARAATDSQQQQPPELEHTLAAICTAFWDAGDAAAAFHSRVSSLDPFATTPLALDDVLASGAAADAAVAELMQWVKLAGAEFDGPRAACPECERLQVRALFAELPELEHETRLTLSDALGRAPFVPADFLVALDVDTTNGNWCYMCGAGGLWGESAGGECAWGRGRECGKGPACLGDLGDLGDLDDLGELEELEDMSDSDCDMLDELAELLAAPASTSASSWDMSGGPASMSASSWASQHCWLCGNSQCSCDAVDLLVKQFLSDDYVEHGGGQQEEVGREQVGRAAVGPPVDGGEILWCEPCGLLHAHSEARWCEACEAVHAQCDEVVFGAGEAAACEPEQPAQ
ncbi:hypothetical protein EDC01DRAFT_750342 [Geopyxis carbonaria]|nr:hypothetical protein EDC01DRAFT_750342 [Geopyxis carbonaria]